MAFKGTTNNPNGRPKGVPNRATTMAREAIAEFVEGNVDRLNGWLDAIAQGNEETKPNPAEAFKLFMSVIEFHIPKLARTEHTGEDGNDIGIKVALDENDRDILNRFYKTQSKKLGEKND